MTESDAASDGKEWDIDERLVHTTLKAEDDGSREEVVRADVRYAERGPGIKKRRSNGNLGRRRHAIAARGR